MRIREYIPQKLLGIEKADIISYQFLAYPLAIIKQNKFSEQWSFSNFIQLCFNEDFDHPVPFCFYIHDYSNNPYLKTEKVSRNTLANNKINIVEFTKNAIKNNQYVYLCVNEYYVDERKAYKLYPRDHDILIYGFNDQTKNFNVLGFNSELIFSETLLSYDNFENAYKHLTEIDNEHLNQIFLYELRTDCHYKLEISEIIMQLKDYLYSKNTSSRLAMLASPLDRYYGLNCYKQLHSYVDQLKYLEKINIKNFHVLYEHKSLMLKRIIYLQDNGFVSKENELSNDYIHNELLRKSEILRNLALKYSIKKDIGIIKKFHILLEEIEKSECKILRRLLGELEFYINKKEA